MTKKRLLGFGGSLCFFLLACSGDSAGTQSTSSASGTAGASSCGAGGDSSTTAGGSNAGGNAGSGGGNVGGAGGSTEEDASPPDTGTMDGAVGDGASAEADGPAQDARAEAAGDTGASDARSAYDPCPPKGKPCIALPLGDSITQGAGSPAPGGGYRVELFHQVVSHGQSITFVGSASSGPTMVDMVPFPRAHEGHGGYTIEQISDLVTTNKTIATYKPDIVMLELGTNNVRSASDAGAAQIPNAIAALGSLVDQILASDSHLLVIVAQITPTQLDDSEARVRAYNAEIPALVRTRAAAGKHVALVDVYSRFVANPNYRTEYFGSEVHPNGAGYVVLGDAWYSAVGPLLR